MSGSEKKRDTQIRELAEGNPNVDSRQLRETAELLADLQREGVPRRQYNIVSPYERKPLKHHAKRFA